MKNHSFLTSSFYFFVVYFIFSNFNVSAQAVIEKKSASEKDYKFESFEVKSVKNSKMVGQKLKDFNNTIKIAFFSENISTKEKEIPTNSLTTPQILKTYTDAVKESLKEGGIHYGITNISYQIVCNKNNILSFSVTNQFMGAHPNVNINSFNFNLNTGKIIENKDIFVSKEAQEKFITTIISKKIKERVAQKIKELEKEGEGAEELKTKELRLENLTFSITETGITFIHDFDLPHVMKAIEPEQDYAFSWSELKDFVKKDGILAPFYKK